MVPLFVIAGVLLAFAVLGALALLNKQGSSSDVAVAKKRAMGRFTAADVAQHSARDDIWVILRLHGEAKVYDVTSYVDEHPGGDAILSNAGGDSTEAFLGPQHPPRVMDLIDDFCIGTLVSG